MGKGTLLTRPLIAVVSLFAALVSLPAAAQEVRYSWLDLSYMAQDFDKMGTQESVPGQVVDIHGTDGDGVRFRGSVGTWNNFYAFVNYSSTDIDVSGTVTVDIPPNPPVVSEAMDEFDLTTIRGGIGYKITLGYTTDIYAELSYDSLDLDFGSFAVENFDADNQDIGAALGVRKMFSDDFELRAYGRFSNQADVDVTTSEFDSGTVFGAGFGWQIVRGLSIVGDYESGEFSNWTIGFRIDLDED